MQRWCLCQMGNHPLSGFTVIPGGHGLTSLCGRNLLFSAPCVAGRGFKKFFTRNVHVQTMNFTSPAAQGKVTRGFAETKDRQG